MHSDHTHELKIEKFSTVAEHDNERLSSEALWDSSVLS